MNKKYINQKIYQQRVTELLQEIQNSETKYKIISGKISAEKYYSPCF